jgi:hypothetical protein
MALEVTQIVMDELLTAEKSMAKPKENPRTAWWLKNKDDPRIVECMREARRKYYYKNQEKEKERGREYYHKKKALAQEQARQEEQEKEQNKKED